ncbi:MAG: tail fiber protein [Pseudomonadota bacterium]
MTLISFLARRAKAAMTGLVLGLLATNGAAAQDRFLGEVFMVGGTFCPRGSVELAGQILPINENNALYALLGTSFGGDGRSNFALPDMRGRSPVAMGTGSNTSTIKLGQKGGAQTHTLSIAEMPSHSHTLSGTYQGRLFGSTGAASTTTPADNFPANVQTPAYAPQVSAPLASNSASFTISGETAAAGQGESFTLQDPVQVITYCIALIGTFPPRN